MGALPPEDRGCRPAAEGGTAANGRPAALFYFAGPGALTCYRARRWDNPGATVSSPYTHSPPTSTVSITGNIPTAMDIRKVARPRPTESGPRETGERGSGAH